MRKDEIHKYGKLLLNLMIYLVAILFVIFIIPKILGFLLPLVIGGVIALIANPLVRVLEEKLKVKRKAGTVVVIVAVIATVCLTGYLIITTLIRQSIGFLQSLPEMWESTKRDMEQLSLMFNRVIVKIPLEWREGIASQTDRFVEYIADFVTGRQKSANTETVTSVAHNIVSTVIDIIMGALAAYFFIADKEYFENSMRKIIPKNILKRWDVVYSSLKQAVGGYFKAQFKIELWIYFLLVIGLYILGNKYAFIVALGIAILDFLPFLGTGAVMFPWAVIKFFTGDYFMCFGLVVMWGGSQLIRQLIQPKIMGDTIGMASIPTLFLLFIGYHTGGVLGMLVAVPLGIIVVNLNQAGLFDTPKLCVKILIANINQYRRLTEEDMRVLDDRDEVEGEGDER